MDDVTSPKGPLPMVRITERMLRKSGHLQQDERIIEWKQGRIERLRVDGSDQPIPKFHGLERISIFSGMTRMSYSPWRLLIYGPGGIWATDLAFIFRIWHAEPRSVCLIYSTYDAESAGSLVSMRWEFAEIEPLDKITAFADRIRMRARARLAGFSAEWQERIKDRAAEITSSASFASELTQLDKASAASERLRPRTIVGLWLRANCLGLTEEREHFLRQINGGVAGWNDDEPGVVEAASELAARRYFGPRASPDQVTELATQIQDRAASTLLQKPDVETVIRYATGDHTAVLRNIRPSLVLTIRGAFIFFVLMKLDIMFELNKLICDAEAIAFERGLKPPHENVSLQGA
jgi:hypothetical protein